MEEQATPYLMGGKAFLKKEITMRKTGLKTGRQTEDKSI